jgi:small subunit ribosomal protein S16
MAVKIRLKRFGRTNRPHYRICVFDTRTRRDGTPIEEIGTYDPAGRGLDDKVRIDSERALYWLGVGAQPSETVASFLRKKGLRKGGGVPAAPVAAAGSAPEA